MSFELKFVDFNTRSETSKLLLIVGPIHVGSAPQSSSSHYIDLLANKDFLLRREDYRFFVASEPLLNVCFDSSSDYLATAYYFKKTFLGNRRVCAIFNVQDAISRIGSILEGLQTEIQRGGEDVEQLMALYSSSYERGEYDAFLRS